MTLADLKVVVELIAIGVGLGYFAAERFARRNRQPSSDHAPRTNGQPTLGEISRRLHNIEESQKQLRTDIRSDVTNRMDGVWGAIKDLRETDTRQQQRIDRVMGQGN